ncbi:hypothetical protein M514_13062 [Trichuris suis]|uniref:Uncharacterized protein n=1 Tax=Trichuris suis TaxID=68888 RepID=A0A085LM62_9BILA|nr:hypothetical protein M513_13062 [Trichuris suis]KFD63246.1 hypothetical protein M514_13062 [Trichuris suis]
MMIETIWIRLVVAALCLTTVHSLECLYFDKTMPTGSVDWWLVYKLPNTELALSLTSRNEGSNFLWQRFSIKEKTLNPMQHTLAQFYDDRNRVAVIAYNNEPPTNDKVAPMTSSSKGIMMWADEANAALIAHTIPRFPNLLLRKYLFPEDAIRIGGAALCATIPAHSTVKWARQLQFEEPLIYYAASPLRNRYFDSYEVQALLTQRPIIFQPYKMSAKFRTIGGIRLVMLGKHSSVRADILSNYLLKLVRDSFRVWGTTGPYDNYFPSGCSGRHQVEKLRGPMELSGVPIESYEDRTVWAVSLNQVEPYYWCLGNSGQHLTNENLASGLMCIDHKNLYELFNDIAAEAKPERCPK